MSTKKCISTCNKFPEAECNPPRCKYVNGQSRNSYCRLSHKYKMSKTNCNVTRKIKKKDLVEVARKRIGNKLKSSKLFLNIVCPKSGICTAFGNNTKELNIFFKGFNDFQYVKSAIKAIGAVSVNGFVKEIEYDRDGYKAHAILKSAQNPDADNLVYEYLVGIKYINRILHKFPCFVETYGLYFYSSDSKWTIMKGTGPIHKSNLDHLILQNNIDYIKACRESKYAALLIQHIQKANGIDKMINMEFLKKELLYVLFIVYHALACISKTFTHYDLHDGNVLVYEPVPGKFIEYHYHNTDGTTTSFFSRYLPKIIDYGRSFYNNGKSNSRKIYDKICSVNECKPNCGENVGLAWLNPTPYFGISSSIKNESHDLRLLNNLKIVFEEMMTIYGGARENIFVKTYNILKKIVYGVGISNVSDKGYGTDENLTTTDSKIYNVNGAYNELKKAVESPDVITENKVNYTNMANKLGDLHIYEDGRQMKYENIK